jgi:hypothetical protein
MSSASRRKGWLPCAGNLREGKFASLCRPVLEWISMIWLWRLRHDAVPCSTLQTLEREISFAADWQSPPPPNPPDTANPPGAYRGEPDTERFRFAHAVPGPAHLSTEGCAARRRSSVLQSFSSLQGTFMSINAAQPECSRLGGAACVIALQFPSPVLGRGP